MNILPLICFFVIFTQFGVYKFFNNTVTNQIKNINKLTPKNQFNYSRLNNNPIINQIKHKIQHHVFIKNPLYYSSFVRPYSYSFSTLNNNNNLTKIPQEKNNLRELSTKINNIHEDFKNNKLNTLEKKIYINTFNKFSFEDTETTNEGDLENRSNSLSNYKNETIFFLKKYGIKGNDIKIIFNNTFNNSRNKFVSNDLIKKIEVLTQDINDIKNNIGKIIQELKTYNISEREIEEIFNTFNDKELNKIVNIILDIKINEIEVQNILKKDINDIKNNIGKIIEELKTYRMNKSQIYTIFNFFNDKELNDKVREFMDVKIDYQINLTPEKISREIETILNSNTEDAVKDILDTFSKNNFNFEIKNNTDNNTEIDFLIKYNNNQIGHLTLLNSLKSRQPELYTFSKSISDSFSGFKLNLYLYLECIIAKFLQSQNHYKSAKTDINIQNYLEFKAQEKFALAVKKTPDLNLKIMNNQEHPKWAEFILTKN